MWQHLSAVSKGLLCLAFASFLFATAGVFIRLASQYASTEHVVFIRNIVGLLMFTPFILKKGVAHFKTRQPLLHLLRSITGISAMYAFFYGIAHFSLSEAMMFVYAAPVFVPVLGHFLLKERVNAHAYLIAFVGISGVFLALQPDQGGDKVAFHAMLLIGLFCTLMSALAFICIRKLSHTEPAERTVFYFTLIGSVLTFFLVYDKRFSFSLLEWSLLIAVGLITTLAQVFLTRGYSYAFAGKIAPASYLTVVFAGFYGWLFWNEMPDSVSVCGYILVFVAAVLVVKANTPEKKTGESFND
ncbi:MAG: DMT family transporter [Pseudomonadales bacterium]|nr:DMT family transporter [Pseudomonadales bacterium]